MKIELTKTIEARKLNPRTLRPLSPAWTTIPYGAILENVTPDGDDDQFQYLGEPYECSHETLAGATLKTGAGDSH
ncbi:MAG: hypothetical protein ABI165_02900 [Bryobacteraceae bacterium]